MTTIFLPFFSPTAERIFCTSETVRRTKMFLSSLKPGSGSFLGVPPVARTSFVYGYDLPEAVVMDFWVKSMEVTSSLTVFMEAESNHSWGRRRIFEESGMRAFESLVRSIGR